MNEHGVPAVWARLSRMNGRGVHDAWARRSGVLHYGVRASSHRT